jgi:hypothetical protein
MICHKTMAQSKVLSNQELYEIEVELLHNDNHRKLTKPTIQKNLKEACIAMHLAVIDEKHYMSNENKIDVIKSYLRLCYAKAESSNISKIYDSALRTPKKYFIGPQPITLERKNVIDASLGVVSIVKDYTVTEKADGERYLLYIDHEGKCYLINNRLSIKYTGVKLNRVINSIYDGELITRDVFGKQVYIFGIFDVYYNNGKDVRDLKLVSKNSKDACRLKIMNEFSKQYMNSFKTQGLDLFTKEFKYDIDNSMAYNTIFDLSKSLLDKHKSGAYPYTIDGLIYTPMYYAVGGMFENDSFNQTPTWQMTFKWKPPHDNTIDFLVKFVKDEQGKFTQLLKDGNLYYIAKLYVGYNPQIHDKLTARKFLTKDLKEIRYSYIPKEFQPDDVVDKTISQVYLLKDSVSMPKCENGDVIEDDSIIEFSYYSKQWMPLRKRHDKTEMLKKFGLSGTANDYSTAMNIWRTIQYPVTEDIITGKTHITKNDVIEDDVYFTSNIDRDKCASIIMKNFHNKFIKNEQLIGLMPKGSSLFDIGCGKAGDLNKWVKANFTKVLGFDVVRDNIENRTNGAYARTIDALKRGIFEENKTSFIYFTADASKKINGDYIEQMDDVDDKYIAKILWGLVKPQQIKEPILHKYYDYVKGGFDVVSCQFCIHYFFENEQTLDNLVYNISTYLKKGGYFIGTCLDGHLIKQKLQNIAMGESIQGVKDDRVIWNIKKLYKKDDKIKLGEQIEVYMESIGKEIKEFLVDFNLLKHKLSLQGVEVLNEQDCKKFGIEKSIDSFKYTYNKVVSSLDQSQLVKDVRLMSDQEKEYSFLNSWFIFKKY